jgi:hypothetical protein
MRIYIFITYLYLLYSTLANITTIKEQAILGTLFFILKTHFRAFI